ncbi:MAG TPA: TlpA disulfide reductase family protein [Pseudomonadales bacterium]|nr:TlpA disulfide reductase family protein [Pseudomonadales bacterium]
MSTYRGMLLFCSLMLFSITASQANVFDRNFEPVNEGSLAPDFTLKDLAGNNVRLEELRGKTILLTFWASWCSPCRIELPHFQALQKKLGRDKVVVLAVSADTQKEDVQNFAKQLKLDIPLFFDEDLQVNQRYRIKAMPTTFIIDSHGIVRHIHMGFKESVLPLYEQELKELLKK